MSLTVAPGRALYVLRSGVLTRIDGAGVDVPAVITGLTATEVGTRQVRNTWDAATDLGPGDTIEVQDQGTGAVVAEVPYDATERTSASLTLGATYTYRARAMKNRDGVAYPGPWSDPASVTIAGIPVEPDPEPTALALNRTGLPSEEEVDTWEKRVWVPPDSDYVSAEGYPVSKTLVLNLDANTDYFLITPKSFYGQTARPTISGGRNVWWRGGEVEFTQCNFGPWTPGGDYHDRVPDAVIPAGDANANQYLFVAGRQGYGSNTEDVVTVIEGFRGKGDYGWEGIGVDTRDDEGRRVYRINCRLDRMSWLMTKTGGHNGGDVAHDQSGPAYSAYRGFTCPKANYQGIYDERTGFGFTAGQITGLELERIDITGDRETYYGREDLGHDLLYAERNRTEGAFPRIVGTGPNGVYLDPKPGPKATEAYQKQQMSPELAAAIVIGPSPYGEMVPADQCGLAYPYKAIGSGPSSPEPPADTFVLRTTKPDATNTGLAVSGTAEADLDAAITEGSVTASSTPITITTGGTQASPRVIRGVHFRRGVAIANGVSWVTFEDCLFERTGTPTTSEWAVTVFGAATTGIVVRNSTARLVGSARHYLRAYPFQGRAITLERCDISGWGDGFGASAIGGTRGYGRALGCHFHDIPHFADDGWNLTPRRSGSHVDGSHPDAVDAQYGLDLLEVIGCTLPGPYTAALLAKSNAASPITKMVVEDNWVVLEDAAGIGFNFLDMEAGGAQDWSVKGNEFDMTLSPSRAAIAASPAFISAAAWEGNVHHDGTPVRVWNGSQLVTV